MSLNHDTISCISTFLNIHCQNAHLNLARVEGETKTCSIKFSSSGERILAKEELELRIMNGLFTTSQVLSESLDVPGACRGIDSYHR